MISRLEKCVISSVDKDLISSSYLKGVSHVIYFHHLSSFTEKREQRGQDREPQLRGKCSSREGEWPLQKSMKSSPRLAHLLAFHTFLKYILIEQWPPYSHSGVTIAAWHVVTHFIPHNLRHRMTLCISKTCQRKHPVCFTSVTCGNNHISVNLASASLPYFV